MALGCSLPSDAATVITLDGKQLEGQALLSDDGQIEIGGQKVDLKNLVRASWESPVPTNEPSPLEPPAPPVPIAPRPQPTISGGLPAGWTNNTIGQSKLIAPIQYELEPNSGLKALGKFTLKVQGDGLEDNADSCQFIWQPLQGDGELVARIVSANTADRQVNLAGIMLRASLEPKAPRVALGFTAARGLAFLSRPKKTAENGTKAHRLIRPPCWVKLEHRGQTISAFHSKDGADWELFDSIVMETSAPLCAGIFACGGRDKKPNIASLSQARVRLGLPPPPLEQLVLTDGTTLLGRLQTMDASQIRFDTYGNSLSLSAVEVAQVRFRLGHSITLPNWRADKSGIIPRNGNFLEGNILAYTNGSFRVKTRKETKNMRAGSEVAAVILHEIAAAPAAFELRTRAGDVLYASAVRLEKKQAIAELEGTGSFSFSGNDLLLLRRLGSLDAATSDLAPAPTLRPGELKTKDGKTFGGTIKLEDGAVFFHEKDQPPVRVELAQVTALKLPVETAAPTDKPKSAAGWNGRDIGNTLPRGTHRLRDGNLEIEGGGCENVPKLRDHFYFVYQPLEGDGEITACLKDYPTLGEGLKIGLMMRDRLEPVSRSLFVGSGEKHGVIFSHRNQPNNHFEQGEPKEALSPLWLRLERTAGTFSAFQSADGRKWELLGSETLELPPKIFVGLCLRGDQAEQSNRCLVGTPTVRNLGPAVFKPRVVLTSGTSIAASITQADDTTVKFTWGEATESSVATLQVARLEFQALTPQMTAALSPGRSGALLRNGDFMDGDFRSYGEGGVGISSVVFGLRTLPAPDEAAAVVLHDLAAGSTSEFVLRDGSRLRAQSFQWANEHFELAEPVLGTVTVAPGDILEFHVLDGQNP